MEYFDIPTATNMSHDLRMALSFWALPILLLILVGNDVAAFTQPQYQLSLEVATSRDPRGAHRRSGRVQIHPVPPSMKFSTVEMSATGKGTLSDGASLAGLVAQPVVWTSLYFVATTGAGLPAGPFGILGAIEGVSYLIVLGFSGSFAYGKIRGLEEASGTNAPGCTSRVETLSTFSLLAGVLTLASLVVDQGCVPNAKPILDYSTYLPVCQESPGLFGG